MRNVSPHRVRAALLLGLLFVVASLGEGSMACGSTPDQPLPTGPLGMPSTGQGGATGVTPMNGGGGTHASAGDTGEGGGSTAVEADSGAAPTGDPDAANSGDDTHNDAGTPNEMGTTEAILLAKSADCLACAQANGCLDPDQGGGTCELVAGNAASGGLTEAALCLKTLNDIVTSQCDAMLLRTQCLCGPVSTDDCLAGTVSPMGAAYQDYVEDFGGDINAIQDNFDMTTYGAGVANVIVDCVGALGCQCLGD